MRSIFVVVLLPCSNCRAGLPKRREQRLVETFIAEAAVEALDEAVLHGLARRDVVPIDAGVLTPLQDRHRCELGAVVRDNGDRLSAMSDNGIKLASDALAGQRCVGDKGETLAGGVVDDRQNPEPSSVGESVADEVQAPALIGTVGKSMGWGRVWVVLFPRRACDHLVCGPEASFRDTAAVAF